MAFGDGAMFVLNWNAPTARATIEAAGRRIVDSGVPGVLVFNLHPANHLKAAPMYEAAKRLVEIGFMAATLGEAIAWFSQGVPPSPTLSEPQSRWDWRARIAQYLSILGVDFRR